MNSYKRVIRQSTLAVVLAGTLLSAAACSSDKKAEPASTTTFKPVTITTLPFPEERALVRKFLLDGEGKPMLSLLRDTAPFVGTAKNPLTTEQCKALNAKLKADGSDTAGFNKMMRAFPKGAARTELAQVALGRLLAVSDCAAGRPLNSEIARAITYRAPIMKATMERYGIQV